MVTVDLVYDKDCPNAEEARVNVRHALAASGLAAQWREWEASSDATPAYLRRYGSPTVLVNGRDVDGAEPGDGACCRVYEVAGTRSSAPPAELIACALMRVKSQRASARARGLAALGTVVSLVAYLAGAVGPSLAAQPSGACPSASTVVAIPIEGMTCASCVARVKKALRAIDGVSDVEVNLEQRRARVRYVSDRVTPEDLTGAINRLGYRAGPPTVEDGKR